MGVVLMFLGAATALLEVVVAVFTVDMLRKVKGISKMTLILVLLFFLNFYLFLASSLQFIEAVGLGVNGVCRHYLVAIRDVTILLFVARLCYMLELAARCGCCIRTGMLMLVPVHLLAITVMIFFELRYEIIHLYVIAFTGLVAIVFIVVMTKWWMAFGKLMLPSFKWSLLIICIANTLRCPNNIISLFCTPQISALYLSIMNFLMVSVSTLAILYFLQTVVNDTTEPRHRTRSGKSSLSSPKLISP
jgi:hypothetical protein